MAKPSLIQLRFELQGLDRLLNELRPLRRGVPLRITMVPPAREQRMYETVRDMALDSEFRD